MLYCNLSLSNDVLLLNFQKTINTLFNFIILFKRPYLCRTHFLLCNLNFFGIIIAPKMALNTTTPLYHNNGSKPNGPCPSTKFTMIFFVFVCILWMPFYQQNITWTNMGETNTVYTKHVTKQTIIMINTKFFFIRAFTYSF